MDENPAFLSYDWFRRIAGDRASTDFLIATILWAVVSILITIAVVWSPPTSNDEDRTPCFTPWFDEKIPGLAACRQHCGLFPFYFLVYYLVVVFTPIAAALRLVLMAVIWLFGIEKCCGVESHCLDQTEPERRRRSSWRRMVEVEAGNGVEDGNENSTDLRAITGEAGAGVVRSAPQRAEPMVAAPEPPRTNAPNNTLIQRHYQQAPGETQQPVGAAQQDSNLEAVLQVATGASLKVAS
ncbi:hypothetical protein QBC40DRAFT_330360 [Triangularia verruculosa]|uniref:Transmembrane protein n=1 Tax=Triangularia verruculosa TaxID=2587418 RepID=A0AAN6XG78_9PEZI|nr:hypothetical protein QBC40DRAFT_330360 [Triangularia verruculosa]